MAEKHDARPSTDSVALLMVRWRVGRKVARNVYAMTGDDPSDDDTLIGQFDTGELAREAVFRHNDALRGKR